MQSSLYIDEKDETAKLPSPKKLLWLAQMSKTVAQHDEARAPGVAKEPEIVQAGDNEWTVCIVVLLLLTFLQYHHLMSHSHNELQIKN